MVVATKIHIQLAVREALLDLAGPMNRRRGLAHPGRADNRQDRSAARVGVVWSGAASVDVTIEHPRQLGEVLGAPDKAVDRRGKLSRCGCGYRCRTRLVRCARRFPRASARMPRHRLTILPIAGRRRLIHSSHP